MGSFQNDYVLLERELRTKPYDAVFQKLFRTVQVSRQFNTWSEIIDFMRTGNSRDPKKNDILKAILGHHSQDQDHRWRTVLLAIFWPGLRAIHRRKRWWDKGEPNEIWQRIFWAFHQTVCRIDLKRRDHRLAQKIINDTVHRLYEEYERDWKRGAWEIATEPQEIDWIVECDEGIDMAAVELFDEIDAEIEKYQSLEHAGLINETDLLLIVGTRIYGKSLTECAREVGLGYQAAKKRRQRAEIKIRRYEKI